MSEAGLTLGRQENLFEKRNLEVLRKAVEDATAAAAAANAAAAAALAAAAAAGNISGTGTIGYIPKFGTTHTLADSPIYTNGTNVGVGTSTPSVMLEVGTSGTSGGDITANSTEGQELAPALTTGNWTLAADWRYTTSPNRLEKYAAGVGTATPTASMGIVAGRTYKVVITSDVMGTPWMEVSLGKACGFLTPSAGTYTSYITAVTTENLIIFTNRTTSRFFVSAVSVKEITFGNLSGKNLLIKGPSIFWGRIGIGTNNPLAQIHLLNGGDEQREVNMYIGSYGAIGQTDFGTAWGAVDKGIIFGNNAYGGIQGYRTIWTTSSYGYRAITMNLTGLYFYATSGATTENAVLAATAIKMSILNSGNVGIGIAAPTAQLHLVKADSSALTDFLINPTLKTSGNLIDAQVGSVSKFKVDNTGAITASGSLTATGGVPSAWPIGSVFISVVSTNPATLLGFGTWAAIGAGRVLVGLDSGNTAFDTVEETGGALTVDSSHVHSVDPPVTTTGTPSATALKEGADTAIVPSRYHTHDVNIAAFDSATGGSATLSIVQPYFVVYMWKRTA
jgi:hypothetical protein